MIFTIVLSRSSYNVVDNDAKSIGIFRVLIVGHYLIYDSWKDRYRTCSDSRVKKLISGVKVTRREVCESNNSYN